jgi:hypothetical protein
MYFRIQAKAEREENASPILGVQLHSVISPVQCSELVILEEKVYYK